MKNLFLFILSLALFSCQPKQDAPIISQVESISYISSRGSGFDIYRNNLEGSAEVKMTKDLGWEWGPQFVRPLKMLIYNSQDTSGVFQQKAMELNGENLPFKTFDLPGFNISPDGQWIAYSRKVGESNQIIIAPYSNIQDSIQITSGNYYFGRQKWSNDGNKIAYISDQTGSNEIYIYNLESKQTQQITNNDKREKYMSWSPDGKQLATTMDMGEEENDIFLINLADLQITQLTDSPINESEIAWSLKGGYVAYHAKVDEKDDIFILSIENKEITKITNGEGYHGEPAWILE